MKSSDLKARLEKALREHRNDPVRISNFGEIPPGVNGIAKVVDCKIGIYEKGELQGEQYWFASGVVIEPKSYNGMWIEGLRTNIIEPLCDTPSRSRSTAEDHMVFVVNELKKLGVVTDDLDSLEDLETICEALARSNVYTRFTTRQLPGSNFVIHVWLGSVKYQQPETETVDISDDQEENPTEQQEDNPQQTLEEPEPQRIEDDQGVLVDNVIKEGMIVKLVHENEIVNGVVYRSHPRKRVASIELSDGTKLTNVPWEKLC